MERWALAGFAADLDLMPGNPMLDACAQSLGASLFRGKAGCKAFRCLLLALAIGNFAGGVDAVEKAVPVTSDGIFDAVNFDEIDTGADDHGTTFTFPQQLTRDSEFATGQLTERAIRSDLENVRQGYEFDGWVLRLTALSDDGPTRAMELLTRGLVRCGGWVLTRSSHEPGISEMDFEFARTACVEIYAMLIGCGLELSRDSHLQLTALCCCTRKLIASKGFDIARVDLVVHHGEAKPSDGEAQVA